MTWKDLWQRWKLFLCVLFDPFAAGSALVAIAMALVLVSQSDSSSSMRPDPRLVATLAGLSTLFAGVAGGVWSKRWLDATETRVLVIRGKAAIRSLKLLMASVSNLEDRVATYLQRLPGNAQNQEVLKTYLEETILQCHSIEEGAVNAIEHWTDIIPEVADATSQIGLISQLHVQTQALQQERDSLNATLQNTEGQAKQQLEQLSAKKEKELSDLRIQLREARSKAESGILGGVGSTLKLRDYSKAVLTELSAPSVGDIAGPTRE